jgi:hypothetical protein
VCFLGSAAFSQDIGLASDTNPIDKGPKRIFGIIPNYRTAPSLAHYHPLTAWAKFEIAYADSTDRGAFVMAAAFAGDAQLTKSTPAFGNGVAGYSRYLGAAYGDLAIGNFMTEAIYPSLLHQDPRYFRHGAGSGWSRLLYAAGQIVMTHSDHGGSQFNFSEVIGNSTAVAISNAYCPDHRTAANAVSKLGIQLGLDTAGNIMKEFWPDLNRKLSRRHREAALPK